MSVAVEIKGHVYTVILHRPGARNAVDRETALELLEAFERFEGDERARVAVLYGEGGTFCAGADLKAIAAGRPNRVAVEGSGPMGPTRMMLEKPVIAAIAGYAVAGGLELALWCDLRVAEEDATLGVFCRRIGVPLIDGGSVRLPRLVGRGRALDLILTGRAVSATEALEMGLVSRVVGSGQSRSAAEELAGELAELPQTCMRQDRRSVYEQEAMSETEALRREFELAQPSLMSPELIAGAASFVKNSG